MPDISIIVVCYRGWPRLIRCLESLKAFKGDRFSFEVIVVDNNSGEETIKEIEKRFSTFRFVYNRVNGGYANGNNLGSSYASGEYILVLNPDTEAAEAEIEKLLITAKQHPEYSIISCRQINENGREVVSTGEFPRFGNLTGFQRSVAKLLRAGVKEAKRSENGNVEFPDWISGSVVWMKMDIYRKLNGFYEGFWMYYEDVDLCRRMAGAGGKVTFLRNVTIEHNHGGSSRVNIKTAALTKTEVQISRHLYVSRNIKGAAGSIVQVFLVINNLISGFIMAVIGILFFFIPKLHLRTRIFINLTGYYINALIRKSWISPRSVLNQ